MFEFDRVDLHCHTDALSNFALDATLDTPLMGNVILDMDVAHTPQTVRNHPLWFSDGHTCSSNPLP